MSNDVFDVFLLRGKEEENGGLTFDPETGLYLRRAEVVQEQGARDEVAWQVLEQKRSADLRRRAELQKLADEKKMKEDTEEKKRQLELRRLLAEEEMRKRIAEEKRLEEQHRKDEERRIAQEKRRADCEEDIDQALLRRRQAKYIDLSSAAGLAELQKLANEETFVEEGWERAVVEERVGEEQEGGRGKRVEEQERGSGSQGREGRTEGRGSGQNQDSDNRYQGNMQSRT